MVVHDLTVKKIFDKDGQKETTIQERIGGMPSFIGTLKYLYAYQNLYNYIAHASSCTPERLDEWYKEFGEFIHNLQGSLNKFGMEMNIWISFVPQNISSYCYEKSKAYVFIALHQIRTNNNTCCS